jgi:hypothetical protein
LACPRVALLDSRHLVVKQTKSFATKKVFFFRDEFFFFTFLNFSPVKRLSVVCLQSVENVLLLLRPLKTSRMFFLVAAKKYLCAENKFKSMRCPNRYYFLNLKPTVKQTFLKSFLVSACP